MNRGEENESRRKLKTLLRELFQFDVSEDLDFGIYRIMNHKKEDMERFIEKDLIMRAEEVFEEYATTSAGVLEKDLEQLRKEINATFGEGTVDDSGELRKREFAGTPRVKEYLERREGLNKATGRVDDVYNHIHEFFSRYFDKGDFFSLKRIGGREKYMIPYGGEEVVLHWANRDQYYIKSGEYSTNYAFEAGGWNVRFMLTQAEVLQNDVIGKNRYFALADDRAPELDDDNKELRVFFHRRCITAEEKKELKTTRIQEALAEKAVHEILTAVEGEAIEGLLIRKGKVGERTSLQKHLGNYVKKNTTDYFIHKDLKSFLERELEFYLKNEVIHLDDLEEMDEGAIRRDKARLKAIRQISQTIIGFLAQIEGFQRALWEKRKFVLMADYCMTLDMVPKEFYTEIGRSREQVAEWKKLFRLDEITEGTLVPTIGKDTLGREYLEDHPYLVLDTKLYDGDFKDRLLAHTEFEHLDDLVGGLMVRSDNFQALSLLMEKFKKQVKCIYISTHLSTHQVPRSSTRMTMNIPPGILF